MGQASCVAKRDVGGTCPGGAIQAPFMSLGAFAHHSEQPSPFLSVVPRPAAIFREQLQLQSAIISGDVKALLKVTLGVTALVLLSGQNPFRRKCPEV